MIKLDSKYSINENNIKDSESLIFDVSIGKERILSEEYNINIDVFAIEDPLYNINANILCEEEKLDTLSIHFDYKASIHRYEVLAFIIGSVEYNGEKHYRIGVIDTTTGQSQNDFINATCPDCIIELYLSDKQFLYNGSNYKLIASKNFKYNKIENK